MKLSSELQARQLLDLAGLRLAAGQAAEALNHVRLALAAHPGLHEAHLLAARIHLKGGQPEKALEALNHHDFYDPDRRDLPEVAMLRATALLESGRDDLAAALLEKLASRFPDDTRAHEMLAGLAIKLARPEKAITHLRELVRLRPGDLMSRHALATLLEKEQPQAAIELLLPLAAPAAPADNASRLWMAQLYRRAGRLREAEEKYRELLNDANDESAAADDPPLWHEAGILADEAGADALAVHRLNRAETLGEGKDRNTLKRLGMAHLHAGRFAAAGYCFWRLTRRHADDADAWSGLAVAALAAGRPRLVKRVRRFLAIHTSRNERHHLLAQYWQHAAAGRAVRHASEATQWPASVTCTSPLQTLLRRAVSVLTAHTHRLPGRADTHFHLAQCQRVLGNATEAHASNEQALTINPNFNAAAALRSRLGAAKPQAA